jgi:hypothetical protein
MHMRKQLRLMLGLVTLLALAQTFLLGSVVRAQEKEQAAERKSPLDARASTGLVLAGKVGIGLGKPFSDFGATPVFELELGYLLPFGAPVNRSIEVFVDGQYTMAGMTGTSKQSDPRLPSTGLVKYDLTQQALALSLGGIYHIDVGSELIMPYAGLGARMYLLKTKVKGSAGGQTYSPSDETQTRAGLLLLGGVEIFAGPGALLAELSFGWASVNSFVLRDTNLGALNLTLGYRLVL